VMRQWLHAGKFHLRQEEVALEEGAFSVSHPKPLR
jgi:hypothetical protein